MVTIGANQFRDIVENLNDGLWVSDRSHRIVYANLAMAAIAGIAVEQLLGTNVLAALPEPGVAFPRQDYLAAQTSGAPRQYACRVTTAGRRDTWQSGWLTPMVEAGEFAGMICTVRNDGEHKSLEDVDTFLARTCSAPAGEPFFQALAGYLAACLELPFVCINRLAEDGTITRPLAFWCREHLAGQARCALGGTACGAAVGGDVCSSPAGDCRMLLGLGQRDYVGTTLCSHAGKPIGRIILIGPNSPASRARAEVILQQLAGRASAELERLDAEDALRAAEKRLRRSEERFRVLVDGSPIGQLLADPCTLRVVACNSAAAEMIGYSREEMLAGRICDFDVDLNEAAIEWHRDNALANGQEQFETRIRRRDGAIRNLSVTLVVVHTAEGARLHVTHLDITERRLAESALQAGNARFRQLLAEIPAVAVHGYDSNGTANFWNKAAERLYGYSAEEAVGSNYLDLVVPPERQEPARQAVALMFDSGQPIAPRELPRRRKDGSRVSVLSSHSIIQGAGQAPEMFCLEVDLSELKRLDEALRQRELYQRALLDNFPFAVWLKDEQSRFLAVNQAFARTFGWPSPQSLVGRNDFDITSAELAESYRSDDEAVMASGRSKQVEEIIESGGQRRWVETYKSPVVVGGRMAGTVGFARDITRRKDDEAALLEAKAEAEKANRAKSRFLAAASHDLRQPLAALSLYVDVLQQKAPAECGELVGSIQNCLDSLSELLAKLLDVSKLDAGVVTPNRRDFAIDQLIAGLVSVHAVEAGLKGLQLRWRRSAIWSYTDQVLLRRILGNLVVNALRYTDKGGVLIGCRRHQGKTWVEVWDTGIGIAADKTDVIFEEFSRLGDDGRQPGSGLGLAIVAKTAALLGLQVRVRSRPGHGSLFAIELPPGRAGKVADVSPAPSASRTLRIGLVEDNSELLKALVCALENTGHEVVAAASGGQLLRLLDGQRPDAVISDYRLAGRETGFDVIEAARAAFDESLPALLVTGDTDAALVRSMADRGIPVCYKPLEVAALLAFIDDATERRSR